MKKTTVLLALFLLVPITCSLAQKHQLYVTYSQSKFIYSSGFEYAFYFNKYIGILAGANGLYKEHKPNQIANSNDDVTLNFHNANVGVCSQPFIMNNHKIGATIGFKTYYSPEFKKLTYYEAGGYYIYFDNSEIRPAFGVDFGIIYSFKRFNSIIKYDTARYKFRFGIGYTFGKKPL